MPQTLPSGAALSVLESVIAARSASSERTGADRVAIAVLDRLGIGGLALDRLSGGQRQMAGLARVLVRDPALLLLDEPISALDMDRLVRLLTEAHRVAAEGGVVLHDLALAAQWAGRIAVLHRGRLHSFGPSAKVVTPAMLADVHGVEARVESCSRGRLMVLIDGEMACAVYIPAAPAALRPFHEVSR